ncbi:MAG: hypothetical protein HY393_04255 [Candidatus Diapherotrites archaeon]|nr:hypothetical protein [Candidatus Diapherotrites archaeon]
MNRKGQSALEYLMTYGWALVVIVIAVAALVILINPSTIQGDQCDAKFGQFTVTQSNVVAGQAELVLVNQTGQAVNFTAATVTGTHGGSTTYTSGAIAFGGDQNYSPNQTGTLVVNPANDLSSGAYSLTYTLTYDAGSLTNLTATGSCRGTI